MRTFAILLLLPLPFVACSGNDSGPTTDPADLPPPAAGAGFQLVTEETAIPAGTEEQDCYFFRVSELAASGGLPAGQPVSVHRIQAAQRKGSHHMNVFRVKTIVGLDPAKGLVQKAQNGVGECFKSSNWADWPLVANSQRDGQIDWTYPDGVANTFQLDEWLMLQTHYVNANTQKTPTSAKVRVNLWTMPAGDVKYQLGTLFATKQSIRVCRANPTPLFEGSCQFKSPIPVHIIGANGHFHSRGKTFEMYSWNGTSTVTPPAADRFYSSTSWDEPLMLTSPSLDRTVPADSGIWYTCGYQWSEPPLPTTCTDVDNYDKSKNPTATLDCCYTFGPIVEKNEHCNAFVYYYPKVDNVNCF